MSTDATQKDPDPHLVALGAYLKARRLATGLSHAAAAAAGDMSTSQIQRVEGGHINLGGMNLLLLMHAIGATLDDAIRLLQDAQPSAEKGRELGERPPAAVPGDRIGSLATEIARDAARDPELISALVGFLAGRRSRW